MGLVKGVFVSFFQHLLGFAVMALIGIVILHFLQVLIHADFMRGLFTLTF